MNKQGITLSLQAIVAIIFAVAVLVLGLFFISNLFDGATRTLVIPEPNIEASATTPLILPFESLVVSAGSQINFSLSYYNVDVTRQVEPMLLACAPQNTIMLTALAQEVATNTERQFALLLTVPEQVTPQRYVCGLSVGTTQQQFVLEVE